MADDYFEVKLSFSDIPEKLTVPFSAVQVFYDPTAAFEAAFDMPEAVGHNEHFNEMVTTDNSAPQFIRTSGENAQHTDNIRQIIDLGKPVADVVSLDAFRKNK